ncbi:MAG: hypothetical protein HYV04_06065 [Deltaproteobacteria bacterium]|nr:hypothetical protein [Deltaproteobacteria bacterium]
MRPDCDILLIATTTGEAANNSILNEWLLQRRSGNSCQVVCGPPGWRSLYACEHEALSILCKNYRHVALGMDSCDTLETRVAQWLTDPDIARDEIGFSCDPATTHVFLCGDPLMIGAPTKRGGWQYDVAASGLVPLLMRHGFTVKTRFKDGNVEYETYW